MGLQQPAASGLAPDSGRGRLNRQTLDQARLLQNGSSLLKTDEMAIANHDDYIAAAPEQFRPLLAELRAQLARTLPDAKEVIEYNMPGFRIGPSIIASYAAFSKQCGLYLAAGAITTHAEDIAAVGLKASKTGITFPQNKPIPADLVERLALTSRNDVGV